jgi:hypothetical protein
MLDEAPPQRPRFHVLSFMATLKAARDFGLPGEDANEIALRFDPRRCDNDHLVDDLTTALLERGVVDLPGSPGLTES